MTRSKYTDDGCEHSDKCTECPFDECVLTWRAERKMRTKKVIAHRK